MTSMRRQAAIQALGIDAARWRTLTRGLDLPGQTGRAPHAWRRITALDLFTVALAHALAADMPPHQARRVAVATIGRLFDPGANPDAAAIVTRTRWQRIPTSPVSPNPIARNLFLERTTPCR